MPIDKRDAAYLWDILQAAQLIRSFVEGMDESAFATDLKTQSAVIHQIEIIGEAVKRLSDGFRKKHPAIPWKEMAGMRDVLIHMYDEVNLARVWKVCTESVPELIAYLEGFVPEDPPA